MIYIVIIASSKLTHVVYVIKFTLKCDYPKCDFVVVDVFTMCVKFADDTSSK